MDVFVRELGSDAALTPHFPIFQANAHPTRSSSRPTLHVARKLLSLLPTVVRSHSLDAHHLINYSLLELFAPYLPCCKCSTELNAEHQSHPQS